MSDSGEYVPTTPGVRECFAQWGADIGPNLSYDEQAEAFDRWLSANNAAVREAAQREVVEAHRVLSESNQFPSHREFLKHLNLNQTGVTDDAQ